MKRVFATAFIICVLLLLPGCSTYEDGFQDGYDAAYSKGYDNGHEAGCEQGSYEETEFDSSASDELTWWRDHAVIVTIGGEKYHTYDCEYVQGHDFYIYNIDLAVSKGYTPCSVCIHQIQNDSGTSSTIERFKEEAEREQEERASKDEPVQEIAESSPLGSVCGPLTLMKQRSAEQTP